MLTFEIPAVKCHNGVAVNWCRYRDTGVTDPALRRTSLFLFIYNYVSCTRLKIYFFAFNKSNVPGFSSNFRFQKPVLKFAFNHNTIIFPFKHSIFLLNIISPFKHCLDLYITDSALKVS